LTHPNSSAQEILYWEIRYVLLLWLSLVSKIPFDLSRFDEPDGQGTFNKLIKIAKDSIGKSGLEREAAANLLARLYARYGDSV
jgi:tubulin-specific chaperone D